MPCHGHGIAHHHVLNQMLIRTAHSGSLLRTGNRCVPKCPLVPLRHCVPTLGLRTAGNQLPHALKTQSPSTSTDAPINKLGSPPNDGPNATLILVAVTVLWGSYNSVIRMLYNSDHPLEPSTLTAIRTAIAAGALMVAVARQAATSPPSTANSKEAPSSSTHATGIDSVDLAAGDRSAEAGAFSDAVRASSGGSASSSSDQLPWLGRTFTGVVPAGVELGLYNFLGTSLQAVGLTLTSATRAGFLVQLTAVITPMLASWAGQNVSPRVWGAATMALAGTCMIALDGMQPGADGGMGSFLSAGDLYLLIACCFYSLATMRLSLYAPRHDPVRLAAVKKITLGTASLAWLATVANMGDGMAFQDTMSKQTPLEWFLVVYSALGPGALATYLQTRGQAQVPATRAQVIYSLTPIWSALMAGWLLGDEGLGPVAWAGSAAICAASILATTAVTADTAKAAVHAATSAPTGAAPAPSALSGSAGTAALAASSTNTAAAAAAAAAKSYAVAAAAAVVTEIAETAVATTAGVSGPSGVVSSPTSAGVQEEEQKEQEVMAKVAVEVEYEAFAASSAPGPLSAAVQAGEGVNDDQVLQDTARALWPVAVLQAAKAPADEQLMSGGPAAQEEGPVAVLAYEGADEEGQAAPVVSAVVDVAPVFVLPQAGLKDDKQAAPVAAAASAVAPVVVLAPEDSDDEEPGLTQLQLEDLAARNQQLEVELAEREALLAQKDSLLSEKDGLLSEKDDELEAALQIASTALATAERGVPGAFGLADDTLHKVSDVLDEAIQVEERVGHLEEERRVEASPPRLLEAELVYAPAQEALQAEVVADAEAAAASMQPAVTNGTSPSTQQLVSDTQFQSEDTVTAEADSTAGIDIVAMHYERLAVSSTTACAATQEPVAASSTRPPSPGAQLQAKAYELAAAAAAAAARVAEAAQIASGVPAATATVEPGASPAAAHDGVNGGVASREHRVGRRSRSKSSSPRVKGKGF